MILQAKGESFPGHANDWQIGEWIRAGSSVDDQTGKQKDGVPEGAVESTKVINQSC
jgi:hypothetical protein